MNRISRIVLTGGPCAGKTTIMQEIKVHFSQRFTILCVEESATELMSGGVFPSTFANPKDYMILQTKLQLLKEEIFNAAAKEIIETSEEDVLIIFDRGLMDVKAYMSDQDFAEMLNCLNLTTDEILSRYHVVYHLVSAAIESPQFYSNQNNFVRKESIAEASILDKKTAQAWDQHKNFFVVGDNSGIKQKTEVLLQRIESFLACSAKGDN